MIRAQNWSYSFVKASNSKYPLRERTLSTCTPSQLNCINENLLVYLINATNGKENIRKGMLKQPNVSNSDSASRWSIFCKPIRNYLTNFLRTE